MTVGPIQGVLCTGNIVFDLLVRPVDRMEWGTSTWVDSLEQSLGGNGGTTCYTLARLGTPVRLLSLIGSDSFGDLLLSKLHDAGVDVSRIGRSAGPSPATIALVNSQGERIFLHRPGSSKEAFSEPVEFDDSLTGDLSHYHLANYCALPCLRPQAAEFLRRAKAAGLTTSLDTGWDSKGRWMEDLGPCLPHTDILFANEDEARHLSGDKCPEKTARFLLEHGAGCVVIKLGGQGCLVLAGDCEIHSPAFPVEALDTTGAGDCFVGGFLAALHRGKSPADAARFANAVAGLSVQRLGAITGLRSYEETLQWMGE
jgi:sugar/nucleoside kinase (ribokinase family)